MSSRFLTIRARALLALGLFFTVIVSMTIYRAYQARNADLRYALERLETHAQLLAEDQNNVVRASLQFLDVMAGTGGASRLIQGPDCSDFFVRYKAMAPHIANVLLTTPSGAAICSALPPPANFTVADRDYFKQALSTPQAVVGKAVIGRITGKWSVPLAQAFRDPSGKIEGVLVLLLDLEHISNEFAIAGYPADARFGLIDSDGTVLVRYPDPDHLTGKNFKTSPFFRTLIAQHGIGTAETAGFDGAPRMFAFAHFAQTHAGPIYLWVGLTRSSIAEKAERQLTAELVMALLLATLMTLAVWFGAEQLLIRPIGKIAETARRLSAGDHVARTGVPHTIDEIGQLAGAFDEMALALISKSDMLRLNRSLEVLSSCNKILVHASNEQQLLHDICRAVVEVGGYRMAWVGFALDDPDKTVKPVAHHGHDEGYLASVQVTWSDTERGQGPTGTAIRTRTSQVNKNFAANAVMKPWQKLAADRGYLSSSAFPLVCNGQAIGALTIYAAVIDPFTVKEIALLEELAADLAYGIGSLRLSESHAQSRKRLELSLEATVQSIAATLELRDSYTAGHQRRVSELAVAIAGEMGMSESDIHGLQLAASIHDLGKIQVPAEILVKPCRLDEYEYKLIQRHPQAGYDILKGIDFPWPIAELVRQHHEHLDGSGYPRGLVDADILPGAKILAIADVVEAMSSHRPYRPALGVEAALDEISRHKGTYFDPVAVDVCIRLFREKGFAFLKDH